MNLIKTTILFHAAICFATSLSAQQKLSRTEQKLVQEVDKALPATRRLLEETVNINSGTMNIQGVKKVGERYAKELAELGFTIEWIVLPDSLKRAGHLVAYKKGRKGKKLFLIGHLDTVFEPSMPAGPFTMINDSTATGQGVNDMKGGDVLVIAALKALHKQGVLIDAHITVYFTGDEENAGTPIDVTRGDFIRRAREHDIALGFETASTMGIVATARRGSSSWRLETTGRQAHSAGIFGGSGYGSVYEAVRILNSFREQLSDEKYLTFNPGLILGGSDLLLDTATQSGMAAGKINIISPATMVMGDLRFLSREQKEKAREKMKAIVEQHLPGTGASITFKEGIPSMPPTPGNEALAAIVNDVSLALGYGAVKPGNPGARGAGDISYVAEYMDCLDGLGASGKGAHAPGETINLNEYPKLIKRTAILLYRLINK
ncbi:MAG TPA: M20/M25/M40 family metallo-hydrolase [Flavisolibacter sp.]|jgi:glutamate carboxypeptidase|nr:M20/M25/M40 family metallo-hydrolase [Flavisolibacter sp.]